MKSQVFRCGVAALAGAGLVLAGRWVLEKPDAGGAAAAESRPATRIEPASSPARETEARPDLGPRVTELEKANAELAARLAEAEARLARRDTELGVVSERLAELRRPMEADIYSSTLRAELASGEVIVTGGYALPDGRRVYAFTQPVVETLPNGAQGVRIAGQVLAVGEEAGRRVGLDTLTTAAANTLQHGEVWVADEHATVLAGLAKEDGMEIATLPDMSIASGASAVVELGDKRLRIDPVVGPDGRALDVEVRMEQTPPPPTPATPEAGQKIPLIEIE